MRLSFVSALDSIKESPSEEELSNFLVISGPNGSGKTNLLQAIASGRVLLDGIQPRDSTILRQFSISQMSATDESPLTPQNLEDASSQLWNLMRLTKDNLGQQPGYSTPEQMEGALQDAVLGNGRLSVWQLSHLKMKSGKSLVQMTWEDLRRWSPLTVGNTDPFQLRVTATFLAYHVRRNNNAYDGWLRNTGSTEISALTDAEFIETYGPPPWELLNETLALIDLPYEFVPPLGREPDLEYEAQLRHRQTGEIVHVSKLSSGEKTLLAIAMTMYSSSVTPSSMAMPQILLLDEADASLHPSMIKNLLQVLEELFVDRFNVRVILATHSPTTVALAREDSLYVMRRSESRRLIKATRDQALGALTVGLPTLSVSTENRRQVFVESEYDEVAYTKLFQILRGTLNSPFSLEFIASGKGDAGGSTAVKHLVSNLRGAGNTAVWGILDKDKRKGASSGIVYSPARYSLENLVLDPLAVGLYLLREQKFSPEPMGLSPEFKYFELDSESAQTIVDFIVGRVALPAPSERLTAVEYLGGFSCNVPEQWLSMNGHLLEDTLKEAIQELKGPQKQLKREVVYKVFGELSRAVPTDVVNLFASLLSAL
ncbi:MAG: hypothetical protein JWM55_606 [Acidimicrobiaceae bacterium]|nr:hypothetical protein [Acidimicrobiaceae bacterium]